MIRTDPVTGNIVSVEQAAFNSKQEAVYDATDLENLYERMVSKILESFSAYLRKGSGWTLKGILRLDITRAREQTSQGVVKNPRCRTGLRGKKRLINMANEDDQCF